MKKKISCYLMSLFLMSIAFLSTPCNVSNVSAQEVISIEDDEVNEVLNQPIGSEDTSSGKTGSITIKLMDTKSGHAKNGVEFAVSKVADIKDGSYVTDERYTSTGIDFNEINTANEMETASRKLQKEVEADSHVMTNDEGVAIAKELPVGVYLVYVTDMNDYEKITPFLIAIPTFDKIDKEMIYDVTVLPKHSPLPNVVVNKVDSVTKKNIKSKDFEFTMYSDEDCTRKVEIAKGDTKKGTATFTEVKYGTYFLKETKAPKGYKQSEEVKKIVIDDDTPLEDGVYSFEYVNVLLPASVKTSDTTNVMPFIAMSVISGIVILTYVGSRKRRNKN